MLLRAPIATGCSIGMATLLALTLASGTALAQAEPTPAAPGTTPAAPPPAAAAPDAPVAAPAAPAEPAAPAAPAEPAAAAAPAEPAPAAAAAPAEPVTHWYDDLKIGAFADAYYAFNFNRPHPEAAGTPFRAYDSNNGFALAWAGLDASYAKGNFGATVNLRFGPSVLAHNSNDAAYGSQYIKQAFATWKPLGTEGKLTIDMGKFDQPFGSEVADSQFNPNYTRSTLFWMAQPLYFTGLRVDYAFSSQVDLKLFAVNGWNRVVDNNATKSFGAQLMLKPADQAVFYVGYMIGGEQPDTAMVAPTPTEPPVLTPVKSANKRMRHFVDVVADINPTPELRLLANGDYGQEDMGGDTTAIWYGANLMVSYKLSDKVFVAPRGGIYRDDNYVFVGQKRTLYDVTATLGYVPSPNFVIKLDGRGDFADEAIYPSYSYGNFEKSQFTATLGVVAMTN